MSATPFAAITLATAALAASSPAPDAPEGLFRSSPGSIAPLASVTSLDESQKELTQGIWRIYQSTPPPDVRGRTLQDDVNRWLMSEPHLARLAALREQAVAAAASHQEAAGQRALSEAAALLEQERDRLYLVWAYWAQQDRIGAHATQFAALAARLPEADVAPRRAPIEAALKYAVSKYEAALGATDGALAQQEAARLPFEEALQQLLDTYNTERGKLGVDLSTAERQAGRAAPFRVREAPCPAPVAETSADDKPAMLPAVSSPESFYPAHTRAMSFEGAMLLEAQVSASGCIERVSVYESSGVQELDQAGIDWALIAARVRPAQREHRPVAAELRFRMRFRLRG